MLVLNRWMALDEFKERLTYQQRPARALEILRQFIEPNGPESTITNPTNSSNSEHNVPTRATEEPLFDASLIASIRRVVEGPPLPRVISSIAFGSSFHLLLILPP
jgi:SRSO17 transposase